MSVAGVALCLSLIVDFSTGSYISPRILRETNAVKEPVIDAGNNYVLICEGNYPLKWIVPRASVEKQKWTTFNNTLTATSENIDYTHRSVLYITNMSYPFVGYYICQYEETGDQDQIYLYVNDPEHLSVEDSYNFHYAVRNRETTIPCRPTAPDIKVQLITNEPRARHASEDGIPVQLNVFKANSFAMYTFEPRKGFWTNDTQNPISSSDWICVFGKSQQKITITIEDAREFLPTPYIEDQSNNHTDVGETLNLICSVSESSHHIYFHWIIPRGNYLTYGANDSGDITIASSKIMKIEGKKHLISKLSIKNSKLEDTGNYSCQVTDKQNNSAISVANIVVHDTEDCYLDIREENYQDTVIVNASQKVQWILDVIGHPVPNLIWYDNKGNEIKNNTVYEIKFVDGKAIFIIYKAHLENAGIYKLRGESRRDHDAKNCPKISELRLNLTVNDKPSICLTGLDGNCRSTDKTAPNIYLINENAEIKCIATGYPLPLMTWEEKNCFTEECQFVSTEGENTSFTDSYRVEQYLKINTTRDGTIKCIASNSLGRVESTMSYFISDVKDGFDLDDFEPGSLVNRNQATTEVIVAENETFSFMCGVSPKKSENIKIFFNDDILNERHNHETIKSSMSKKITVSLKYTQLTDSGNYSCRIENTHDNSYEYRNLTLIVKEPQQPVITITNLDKEILVEYPKMKKELICHVTGIPKPSIEWYKGSDLIYPSKRIIFQNDSMVLKFISTELNDEGVYRCYAYNSLGSVFKEAMLKFVVKPVFLDIYYYITGSIAVLLVIALIYIFLRIRKERKLLRKLKRLGLENFHNGNPENLNPELGIDDQAELLPYNQKFEFPIENLKIGKQLGSGAFGVVLKAEAKGIIQGEPKSIVAVKVVKKNADDSYIKALASELKIMVHLGRHINVVNLLGACTKNVAKRELLVIVEFCRFGNLQHYIYKHRSTFINQVDPVSGNIDYNIGADILERTYSISSENCNSPVSSCSMQDYRERIHTMSRQLSSTGGETVIMSNNSSQPEWQVNYKGDYRGDVKPISTRELLTWAFQVARGMEYLASRKVLHGDLAARNILLSDNNVVKICDFGLAKTMYNDNNYKKKGNGLLPIKWMAIESIRDRVFSTQSDVWSYGIVLWELFSLARTPYPGIEADERLYHKLVEGYRMEAPPNMPRDISKIMLDCWHVKPLARPSFRKLADSIGVLLEDSVRKHYVDLNDPYLRMNTEKLEDEDYLAMLSPPSFDVLSTPTNNYNNAEMFARARSTGSGFPGGYVPMGTNTIFSPRILEDEVFYFVNKRPGGNLGAHELYPMLSRSEDDTLERETGYLTPITPVNSISNPTYHHMPTIRNENSKKVNSDIIRTPDNYISMHQYKNIVNSNFRDSGIGSPVQLDLEKTIRLDIM